MSYSPKISPILVSRLFRLRESLHSIGEKATMVSLTEEALNDYLPKREKEIVKNGGCLLLVGEPRESEKEG